MATIKRSILGKFSGSAGDLVFVLRNGKRHFRSKPKPRDPNKPKSQKTIDNEAGFAYTSLFAKEISKSDLLKFIWKNSNVFGENYYGRIFSANRKSTKPSGLTLNNKITPDNIFMKTNSLVWDDDFFSLNYEIERVTENSLQPPFYAVSILYLCDPHDSKRVPHFTFLSFEELVTEQFTDKPNIITFKFVDSDKETISQFKKGIIYLSFISNDLSPKSVEGTTTTAVEINISL